MPRLVDADALINDVTERYCKDCDRRKGIKNGVIKTLYEIGEAPCRACPVDDMKDELENAPTVDAEPVVRCKDCKHNSLNRKSGNAYCDLGIGLFQLYDYCSHGERTEDG